MLVPMNEPVGWTVGKCLGRACPGKACLDQTSLAYILPLCEPKKRLLSISFSQVDVLS